MRSLVAFMTLTWRYGRPRQAQLAQSIRQKALQKILLGIALSFLITRRTTRLGSVTSEHTSIPLIKLRSFDFLGACTASDLRQNILAICYAQELGIFYFFANATGQPHAETEPKGIASQRCSDLDRIVDDNFTFTLTSTAQLASTHRLLLLTPKAEKLWSSELWAVLDGAERGSTPKLQPADKRYVKLNRLVSRLE